MYVVVYLEFQEENNPPS